MIRTSDSRNFKAAGKNIITVHIKFFKFTGRINELMSVSCPRQTSPILRSHLHAESYIGQATSSVCTTSDSETDNLLSFGMERNYHFHEGNDLKDTEKKLL